MIDNSNPNLEEMILTHFPGSDIKGHTNKKLTGTPKGGGTRSRLKNE